LKQPQLGGTTHNLACTLLCQFTLARTIDIHRVWLYIWWFPSKKYWKYCIYTVYVGCGQPYK